MASNISVAITVDNKQYISNINAANSATQKFAANTTKSLNNINLVSDNLISRIGGLKTALAGLVSATAIQSANNFANAIKDIATTTDISIETILGLSRAFEVNGGTAEGAQNSLLKFADSVAQARAGNDSALKSFKDIGISIDTLNKTGIEELTKRSIAGIAGLSSSVAQIRNQTDLFGKTAKGVSFGGVQQTTQGQTISPETVAALKSGADASENMKKQFSQLTDALLRVAQPLNDIVKGINVSVSAFESLIKAILAAIAAFALFKGIGLINGLLGGLSAAATATGGVVAWFAKQFVIVAGSIKYFILNLGRAIGLLPTAFGGLTSVGFALGALVKGFLRFAGVIGIIYTLVEAIDFLSKLLFNFSPVDYLIEKFNGLLKVAKEFFNIKPTAPDQSDAETKRLANQNAMLVQLEKDKKARDEAAAATAAYQERVAKLNAEIRKTGDNLKYQYNENSKNYEIEKFLVGKSEEQVELFRAMDDAAKQADDAINGLNQRRKEMAMGTEEQRANLGLIDAEIARVRKLSTAYIESLPAVIGGLQGVRAVEKARLADIENMTKALEAQLKIQEALTGARLSIISQGQDVAFAGSKIGKGDLQKQMMDIVEANRKAGQEASKAFSQAFDDNGDGLTSAQAQQLATGLDAIAQGYANISAAQLKNLEDSRTWSAGWGEAFQNYKDNAQNAAEESKTYFNTFTKGIEDVFVKFVQTGKLSFKDLANSMIADFARIQAQKALSGLFGGGGIGGGLFGSIGKLFGFANGGYPPLNQPSIVGERGPELFVPQSAGKIIPNHQLGGGQPIVNNNNTAVTYSIQAVDASSFRSMLARDPEFIHNVAEQGRRQMPIRSRR
jgi:hypothetical protein